MRPHRVRAIDHPACECNIYGARVPVHKFLLLLVFIAHTHITAAAVTSDTTFGKHMQTQNPTKRPFRCFMLASVPASSYRTCLFVKGTLITKLVRACVLSYAMCELPFFIRSFLLLFSFLLLLLGHWNEHLHSPICVSGYS